MRACVRVLARVSEPSRGRKRAREGERTAYEAKKQLQRTTRKTKNKAAAPRLVTKNTKTMISCHDRSINDAKQKKSKSRSDKVPDNTCFQNPSF